jgi:hypothetical protein
MRAVREKEQAVERVSREARSARGQAAKRKSSLSSKNGKEPWWQNKMPSRGECKGRRGSRAEIAHQNQPKIRSKLMEAYIQIRVITTSSPAGHLDGLRKAKERKSAKGRSVFSSVMKGLWTCCVRIFSAFSFSIL